MLDIFDLIRFSDRDYQGNMLTPFAESLSASAAGTSVFFNGHADVPINKLLLITSWSLLLTPGATQFAVVAQMMCYQATNGRTVNVYGLTLPRSETIAQIASIPYELLFFPGDRPVVQGNFNAGVNSNQLVSSIRGFLIPRGMVSP